MSEKLFVVIPAYNEAENIRAVIDGWSKILNSTDGGVILLIDDGSKDDTFRIIQDCAKDNPSIIPITKENGGHGSAVLYGYNYAISHGADYVFQTDSDGQTLPEEFPAFWDLRREYDAIFGCRSNRKEEHHGNLSRKYCALYSGSYSA